MGHALRLLPWLCHRLRHALKLHTRESDPETSSRHCIWGWALKEALGVSPDLV